MSHEQSIRPFLTHLEQQGELLRIAKPVHLRHEIAAFLSAADAGPALLFENVSGASLKVVGNLLTSRTRVAQALGIEVGEILPRLQRAIREPVKPVRVTTAPVQEVIEQGSPLAGLPVPTFFEREHHPYITAGVILARDPESGRGNLSFARFAILDERRAMIGIAPNHHLALFARRAAAAGRPLPIAVAIGAHPAIQLAACLYLGVGDDELECAGRLLGEPVRVVPTRTIELVAPADAEVVLEGVIEPGRPIEEGLVSEFHGLYEDYGPGLLTIFSAQTRRADALFQVIEPGYHREHMYLGALPIAAALLHSLAAVVPNVRDVAVTEAGGGRTDVIVQVDAPRPGQARRAMYAVFAAVSLVKRVTVVDADIDPWDAGAVEWARTNRMRMERDLLLLPLSGADRSEPMEHGGTVTKVGFDATAKGSDRVEGSERALPPAAAREAARRWLDQNVPAERRPWLKGPERNAR
ncbi:MAG TPA: UbiD family decarboxylase [Steroidobacteraceae bacterium]|nr:UbiD family decarboxylase [Steroidobacteraceae bacterium]